MIRTVAFRSISNALHPEALDSVTGCRGRFIENASIRRVYIVNGGSIRRLQSLVRFHLGQELAQVGALNLVQLKLFLAGEILVTGILLQEWIDSCFKSGELCSSCLA